MHFESERKTETDRQTGTERNRQSDTRTETKVSFTAMYFKLRVRQETRENRTKETSESLKRDLN